MSVEHLFIIFGAFANIATVAGFLLAYASQKRQSAQDAAEFKREISIELAEVRLMTQTMWDFHFRRAGAEMVHKKLGTLDSPLDIRPEVLAWYDSLKPDLRGFFARLGLHDMSDRDLAIEIERNFGGRMLKEICIPRGISQGECLLIATAVAKGSSTVELPDVSLDPKDASAIAEEF